MEVHNQAGHLCLQHMISVVILTLYDHTVTFDLDILCITDNKVPDTKGGVKFNPDGTLDRGAMLAIMNPDDKAGLVDLGDLCVTHHALNIVLSRVAVTAVKLQ